MNVTVHSRCNLPFNPSTYALSNVSGLCDLHVLDGLGELITRRVAHNEIGCFFGIRKVIDVQGRHGLRPRTPGCLVDQA